MSPTKLHICYSGGILKHGSWKEWKHPPPAQRWPVASTAGNGHWHRCRLWRKEHGDPLAMSALDHGGTSRTFGRMLGNADPKGTRKHHWGEPSKWHVSHSHPKQAASEMKILKVRLCWGLFTTSSCSPSERKFSWISRDLAPSSRKRKFILLETLWSGLKKPEEKKRTLQKKGRGMFKRRFQWFCFALLR